MLNWKQSLLALLIVSFGTTTFWLWHKLASRIALGEVSWPHDLALPLLGLVISAALFSFSAILVEQKWVCYGAAVACVNASYFFISPTNASLAAFAVSALLLIWAVFRMRREAALSLNFSLAKILKTGLPLYFTSTALLTSFFYFIPLRGNEELAVLRLFPKTAADAALKIISGQLKSSLGMPVDLKPEITVNGLLRELAAKQSRIKGVPLSALSGTDLETLLREQREAFSAQYGIALRGDEKIGDALRNLAVGKIKKIMGPYWSYTPIISAVAFFAAFKILAVPLTYLTMLAAFILLKIAFFARILRSEKRQIEVERLAL